MRMILIRCSKITDLLPVKWTEKVRLFHDAVHRRL